MIDISPTTSVKDLIEKYPVLVDFLIGHNPKFAVLKNPIVRATVGKVATLEKAAEMGAEDVEQLISAIRDEIMGRATDDHLGPENMDTEHTVDRV